MQAKVILHPLSELVLQLYATPFPTYVRVEAHVVSAFQVSEGFVCEEQAAIKGKGSDF
jgi:hypothetical protein